MGACPFGPPSRRAGPRRISVGTPAPTAAARAPSLSTAMATFGRPRACAGTLAKAGGLAPDQAAGLARAREEEGPSPAAAVTREAGPAITPIEAGAGPPLARVSTGPVAGARPSRKATSASLTRRASSGRLATPVTSPEGLKATPCTRASRSPRAAREGTAALVPCLAGPAPGSPRRTPSPGGRPTRLGT